MDESATDGTALRYVGTSVRDFHTARVLLAQYGPFVVLWQDPTANIHGPLHAQADLEQMRAEVIDFPQGPTAGREAGAHALERVAKIAVHLPSRDADDFVEFLTECAAEIRATGVMEGEGL